MLCIWLRQNPRVQAQGKVQHLRHILWKIQCTRNQCTNKRLWMPTSLLHCPLCQYHNHLCGVTESGLPPHPQTPCIQVEGQGLAGGLWAMPTHAHNLVSKTSHKKWQEPLKNWIIIDMSFSTLNVNAQRCYFSSFLNFLCRQLLSSFHKWRNT